MTRKIHPSMRAAILLVVATVATAKAENTVHIAIHRHLHQPIYWGEPDDIRPNQSQFAGDSQRRKNQGLNWYGGPQQNPENQLVGGNDSVFEKPDRINAYQNWIKSSIGAMSGADAGMTLSFSGGLQRNLWSFGRDNAYGYSTDWAKNNKDAIGGKVSNNQSSRADMMGMTYNHALSPLLPRSVLRKQIAMHRERGRKSWDQNANFSDHSKGYWPVEIAFSEAIIPVLKEFDYQWVIVANSHIARTVQNYEQKALAAGELRADPPNRADLLGPTVPDDQWYAANLDSYGNAFPVPYSYQPAWVKHVDPDTGQESKIIAIPACDFHGYRSGFGSQGYEYINDKIAQYNDPARPSLVLLANDGENFWGGGNSFWNEFAPQFMNDAPGNGGKKATTIQKYLDDHPVPVNALIHVEDGSWLAADQGSPQFYRWLEPPRRITGRVESDPKTYFDIENGWHVDMRNWAVLLAGVNFCETAEQIVGPANVMSWRIEEPYQDNGTYNNPSATEQAWHFLMWGFDSGFMYFGVGLDDEVKQTFAANRAINLARPVIGNGSQDDTPPTVFKPQRFPWNPGGKGRGQYMGNSAGVVGPGYNGLPVWSSDFWIWTLVYDVSTATVVNLKVRVDGDGVNPLNDNANEQYAGGPGVGSWVTIPMTKAVIQKTDPFNSPDVNFFQLPGEIANRYWAKVNGYRGQLLDYYIEAQDSRGNLTRTEIQHVYVEDDGTPGGGGGTSSASFSADPRDCAPLVTTFSATNGPLEGVSPVYLQISFSNGQNFAIYEMVNLGPDVWVYTNAVPDNAPNATVWFQNFDNSLSDNNFGGNWFTLIRDCDAPTGPSAADTVPATIVGCDPVTIRYFPNAGPLQTATQVYLHAGYNGWQGVGQPNPPMTKVGNHWEYIYAPTVTTYVIDAAFNNGAGTWDNNNQADWHFSVSGCPPPVPPGIVITNPPSDIVVPHESSSFDLRGTAGSNLVGQLIWTNHQTGGSGFFSAQPLWLVGALPLSEGTNLISVSGSGASGSEVVVAEDSAADPVYIPDWDNGDNGGSGWDGGWVLNPAANTGQAGHFRAVNSPMLSIGTNAWGLYANNANVSEVFRPFAAPLASGQTFRVKFDNNYIDNGGVVGLALQNTGGSNLFEFLFFGGQTNYVIHDSIDDRNSGINYTADGLSLAFTLTGPDTYRFSGGTSVITGTLKAPAGGDQEVRRLRVFNFNAGSGSDRDFFFNELLITEPGVGGIATSAAVVIERQFFAHDGIPMSWWNRFGLGNSSSAAGQSDGDGINNGEEWVADTDPTNPASFYSDAIFEFGLGGSFEVLSGVPTTNSRVYDVWASTSLVEAAWSPLGLDVPGAADGSAVPLHVPDDTGPFFRTGVKLP